MIFVITIGVSSFRRLFEFLNVFEEFVASCISLFDLFDLFYVFKVEMKNRTSHKNTHLRKSLQYCCKFLAFSTGQTKVIQK